MPSTHKPHIRVVPGTRRWVCSVPGYYGSGYGPTPAAAFAQWTAFAGTVR